MSGVGFSVIIEWKIDIYTWLTGKGGRVQQEQKKSEPQTESRNLHHEDLALKTAAQYFGEELMPLLGITGKAKYVAPTELIKLEARQMYQDFNYVSADNTWIHLEFESDSITTEDLRRFREYEATTSRTYHVQVITYVICSSQVRKPITKLTEGISIYRIKAVRMKDRNSDRLFALLEAKEKQGVPLEKEDLVPLLLSPLMSGRLTIGERIVKSLHFLQSSPNAVTKTELEKMQAVMYTLALKFLSKKDLGKVKEMIFMTELGQMLVDDGIEIGLAKGESKIVAMIRKKLAKGLTISAISEELELDGTYVKKVISLISEDASRNDLEIAEILISQN